MATPSRDVELRFMVEIFDARVLDGYCSSNGSNRAEVLRGIVHEWAERKFHEATMICRVADGNPSTVDKRGSTTEA
jgi:hypothetical protein